MKNYTKFTAIFLVLIVALVCPVFAASSGWNSFTLADDDWRTEASYYYDGVLTFKEGSYQENTNRLSFSLPALTGSDTSILQFHFTADASFTVSAGDTIAIDAFTLRYFIGGATNYVKAFRVTVGTSPLNPDFASPWYETGFTSGQAIQDIAIPNQTFSVTKDLPISQFNIEFEIYHPAGGYLNITRVGVNVGYGNPNSPEAPGYVNPNGDYTTWDDYLEKDKELMNGLSSSITDSVQLFANLSGYIQSFQAGLALVSSMMFYAFSEIQILTPLLYISLGLGLVAFVLGLAGSIIGARDKADKYDYMPVVRKEEKP